MNVYYIFIIFILFLLVASNIHLDHKIFALDTTSKMQKKFIEAQLTHQNKSLNFPLNGTYKNANFEGTVDSWILLNNENYWLGIGNWNLTIRENIPTFELNMTWYP